MTTIVFDEVTKRYPDGTEAVRELELAVGDGELLVLVGPSGCGKSTALRMVAGLEEISEGRILIGDRVINGIAPKDRDVAMVFQNYALYPHMTVRQNIAYALRLRRLPRPEIDRRVAEVAELLEIGGELERRPARLSGGQRQRVAMGRALVREPAAFLMDEPLSNLDAKLRVQMRAELSRIQRRLQTTTIYVTHDQVEAMTLGDRVAVMRDGVLQQLGTPREVYDRPTNVFVAGFIGSPPMNLLPGRVDGGSVLTAIGALPAPDWSQAREVTLGLRPEAFRLADEDDALTVAGEVLLAEAVGPEIHAHVDIGGGAPLVARVPATSTVRPGERLRLAVDASAMHLFDQTGNTLRDGSAALSI